MKIFGFTFVPLKHHHDKINCLEDFVDYQNAVINLLQKEIKNMKGE